MSVRTNRMSMHGVATASALLATLWTSTSAMAGLDEANTSLSFQPEQAAAAPASSGSKATYLLSDQRIHSDPKVLWDGFLSGLRGFDHFYDPIGQPLYFESPLVNTSARLLFLHHEFADNSQLQGGQVNVVAAQARLAITERIAFIATKDGYSWFKPGIFADTEEGWNDIAIGLKWAFWVDREHDFVATVGGRWQWGNGDSEILQGLSQEISPFVSFAKGFDRFHLIGNLTLRIPTDSDKGNTIFHWDLHADYEVAPEVLPGLAPCIELHGVHYLKDADTLPFSVGGLDYANIGSGDVAGSTVVWAGVGARWKLTPNLSFGAVYEFALTNRNADIMDDRVTLDLTLTW